MTPNQNRILLLELADVLLRSWWLLVAGACLGAVGAEAVLYFLQPVYESRAVVFANAARLPQGMVRMTVPDAPAELQLGLVRGAVLTHDNIVSIARAQFERPPQPAVVDDLVERIKDNVAFESNADPRKALVTIRYRDTDRARAARVANAITTLVVSVNTEIRADKAAQVTKAFESLSRGVETELESVNRQIRELRSRYPFQTEDQREVNERKLRDAEAELDTVGKELANARDRLATSESERESARGFVFEPGDAAPDARGNPEFGFEKEIAKLQSEVEGLRLRYEDSHPKVQSKLGQIEELKRRTPSEQPATPPRETPAPVRALERFDYMESLIRAERHEVERLERENARLTAERDRYRGYIADTPRVQQDLEELNLRRQRLENDFDSQQAKIDTARTGQQIEEEELGNPFEIVDDAHPAAVPAWPNRLLFLGGGVLCGMLLFAGPLVAIRLIRPVISSEAGLRELGDVPVLVTIPVIPTTSSDRRARVLRLRNWGLVAASVVAVIAVQALRIVL